MILFTVCVLVAVGLLVRRRRRMKARLAGLEAARPVYSVTPPGGRLGRLRDTRL